MCGIAGIVGPGAPQHRELVAEMLRSLDHRGPDDRRMEVTAEAVIGATRLAVIDPDHGQQPLVDEAGVIVAGNGEIYGYRQVRTRLSLPPTGGSDLNVVAPLWHRHGSDLLPHLPGTFALAVFDPAGSRLLLGRDPFGERPLYWAEMAGGCLAFASEPGALLDAGIVAREVDRSVLAEVVRTGYVAPGSCIWQGMQSLRPGHQLIVDLRRGTRAVERWWSAPPVDPSIELPDAIGWFRHALDRAVVEQLDADVPLGVFLSGGLDSATIAGLAAGHRPGLVALACDVPDASEVGWATRTAQRHGLDLRVCPIDESSLVDDLLDSARAWGEPIGDSSALLTWILARFTKEHVTVVLSGDGADELLGGYVGWARDALGAEAVLGSAHHRPRWWRRPSDPAAVTRAYRRYRDYASPADLHALGLPAGEDHDLDEVHHTGTVEDICRFDLDRYLPGDILVKTDRASMAHGLEVRAPFLARPVAEGCLALPAACKVDDRREKVLLRDSFEHLWPTGLSDRPKQGFGAPTDRWLRLPAVAGLADELVRDPAGPLAGLLEVDAASRLLDAGGQAAWTVFAVARWWAHHRSPVAA
ncbi:asparagine synthase (glutamine-hydrolyzing) [Aquihabitans sp. McL0605]|uniref:asparagine synthase (glutamine-hydrolyzing) n=1 Tax=Aquihabitans sp. McL0605 TaxID=3415671 RepID=UPI003CF24EAA